MIAPFEPASYPGPRPDGPVLVHEGRLHDVAITGDGAIASPADAPVLAPGVRRWVVAYGSNASPGRVVSKRLDRLGAVLLPATIEGWTPAFEDRRTAYGAVPLTFVPVPGVRTSTWVLGLHVDDTEVLDASEGRLPADRAAATTGDDLRRAPAGTYRLGHVGPVEVAGSWLLRDALAYLPAPGTRVQVDEAGTWRDWPGVDQTEAAAHVDAGGPSAPPPSVPRVVEGAWPPTPFERVR